MTANRYGDRVDCVVRAGRIADPSLIAGHVGDLPFVTCATPHYLQRHGTTRHPNELANGHTLVRFFLTATGGHLPIKPIRADERAPSRAGTS